MMLRASRRRFLQAAIGSAAALALRPAPASTLAGRPRFSFVLLGDLHFDRLEHHDHDWLRREKPDDVRQVENYSRLTREVTPSLFATVREVIAERQRAGAAPVAFVLQVGDLVEGLCGTPELALRQNREAVAFVRGAKLGAPFLFTKGNHDVTGPGATEAFAEAFHPFLTGERLAVMGAAPKIETARFTVERAGTQFAFFDAYDPVSLEWFEDVAARRTAEHLFVVIHPPVVPYGARATWHLYSSAKDQARRAKLLELLAHQRAMVLGGHIHKFNTLARTAGGGRFAQLAVSSILNAPVAKAKDVLTGLEEYTGDQIRVEPKHSPTTEAARRAVYDAERPHVKAFEYADLPGYAVVTVDGAAVHAEMFAGASRELFRRVELHQLLAGGA